MLSEIIDYIHQRFQEFGIELSCYSSDIFEYIILEAVDCLKLFQGSECPLKCKTFAAVNNGIYLEYGWYPQCYRIKINFNPQNETIDTLKAKLKNAGVPVGLNPQNAIGFALYVDNDTQEKVYYINEHFEVMPLVLKENKNVQSSIFPPYCEYGALIASKADVDIFKDWAANFESFNFPQNIILKNTRCQNQISEEMDLTSKKIIDYFMAEKRFNHKQVNPFYTEISIEFFNVQKQHILIAINNSSILKAIGSLDNFSRKELENLKSKIQLYRINDKAISAVIDLLNIKILSYLFPDLSQLTLKQIRSLKPEYDFYREFKDKIAFEIASRLIAPDNVYSLSFQERYKLILAILYECKDQDFQPLISYCYHSLSRNEEIKDLLLDLPIPTETDIKSIIKGIDSEQLLLKAIDNEEKLILFTEKPLLKISTYKAKCQEQIIRLSKYDNDVAKRKKKILETALAQLSVHDIKDHPPGKLANRMLINFYNVIRDNKVELLKPHSSVPKNIIKGLVTFIGFCLGIFPGILLYKLFFSENRLTTTQRTILDPIQQDVIQHK